MKKTRHSASREHALQQATALCLHAVLKSDECARSAMSVVEREEIARLLFEGGAHLELVVRITPGVMTAALSLVQLRAGSRVLLNLESKSDHAKSGASH